jgi:mono/diheme cytochrome c family protein
MSGYSAEDHAMSSYRAQTHRMWKVAIFAAMLLAAVRPTAIAEEERTRKAVMDIGREEFQESCAACHGPDASGRGELANKLVKPPKDLTMIAERNGGTFPFWMIFDIIAGDTTVEGHDTSQMPLFSQRMRGQESAGVFPPAPLRVLALTHYLESIQE